MRTAIDIKGVISKEDFSEITEKEMDTIYDKFIALLVENNYMFGGGVTWFDEDEIMADYDGG